MKKIVSSLLIAAILILTLPGSVLAIENPQKPITPGELRGITFVHYAKPDKPGKPPRPEPTPPPPEGSYLLLGLFVDGTMDCYVNYAGSPEGSAAAIANSFATWEAQDISDSFGFNYITTTTTSGRKSDGQNTISWTRIAPKSTIAITTMWYYYDGDSSTPDPIVEFDIVFNSFLNWGVDPDGEGGAVLENAFDVQNIATHEIGHVLGLGDLYSSVNDEMTMYGYGSEGETRKISLEDGDKAGIIAIYS